VGVSGGPDSVCLLNLISQLDFEIIVAHFNHGLRKAAQEEMMFVQKMAERLGLMYFSEEMDIKQTAKNERKGIEECSRFYRYKFLFSCADRCHAQAVLTAHQADDQVETILMNLIRGAGLRGLSGIKEKTYTSFSTSIPLVRPLLKIWREEIEEFCKSNRWTFMVDETNKDVKYLRNRIRSELLPVLSAYNPGIKNALRNLGETLNQDLDLLETISLTYQKKSIIEEQPEKIILNADVFRQSPKSIQRMIIRNIYEKHFRGKIEIDFSLIEKTCKFISGDLNTTTLLLQEKIYLILDHQNVIITCSSKTGTHEFWPIVHEPVFMNIGDFEYSLTENWLLQISVLSISEVAQKYHENEDEFTAYLDADIMDSSLEIRNWVFGDRYVPMGMNGSSIKLSDFWINKKISKLARNRWPLIFSGKKLVWIPGFQPSELAKITDQTQRVLCLKLVRKD